MGVAHSSSLAHRPHQSIFLVTTRASVPKSNLNSNIICFPYLRRPNNHFQFQHHHTINSSISAAKIAPLKYGEVNEMESEKTTIDLHAIDENLVKKMVYDDLVWSSLHGLVVGDKSVQRSGTVPGVGMVHAPFALLPVAFPEIQWKLACEVAPIFNELVDRVNFDGKFLQEALSRTKKVDIFTSRLLDIHSKMLEINKKEDIRLGLHRSYYMLDEQTKELL